MNIFIKVIVILILVFYYLQNPSLAQNPADLDSTFGINGIVNTDIASYYDAAYSVAIQTDGKIILTGYSLESSAAFREITTIRYLPDGSIDNSFGTNGIVISDVSNLEGEAYSAIIQSDGKIVGGGYSGTSGTDDNFTAIRYDSSGNLDNTFGVNGVSITDIAGGNGGNDVCESTIIQPDGKILLAGWTTSGTLDDIVVMRLNTDGILDNSFGSGGIVKTDINSGADYGKKIAIQTDGKLIVTGHNVNYTLGQWSIFVARYDSSGNLDNSFGNNGIVITSIGTVDNDAFGQAVTIQEDGKIIVGGTSNSTGSSRSTLVRYNPNGTLDNSFGNNGIVISQVENSSGSSDIMLDAKGYIYVGAEAVLARYDTTGNLDTSFGSNGTTGAFGGRGYSLAIQNDGKIIFAGERNGEFSDFAMARYTGDYSELKLLAPNGGEEWEVGKSYSISWNYFNLSKLKIEYSIDGGSSWMLIKDSLSVLIGTYDWVIPNTQSEQCLIKISDVNDPNIFDVSDATFSILTLSSISIIAPNGGEIWSIGETESIKWSSENVSDVKIQLSINNGVNWVNIVDSMASTGIYNWQIPAQLPSSQCRIKIINLVDNYAWDMSDNPFTIDYPNNVEEQNNNIPVEFQLLQNFPNPFNPVTTIEFGLPEARQVRIKLYNTIGEEILTLLDGYREAGYHQFSFDASNLNTGIYFYKLQAGDFVETKKMLLLK